MATQPSVLAWISDTKGALKTTGKAKADKAAAAPAVAQRPDRPAAGPPVVSLDEQAARPSRQAPPTPAELQQEKLRKEKEKQLAAAKALEEWNQRQPKDHSLPSKKEKPIVNDTDVATMQANLAKMDYPKEEEKSAAADQPKARNPRWDEVLAKQKKAAEEAPALKLKKEAEAKAAAEEAAEKAKKRLEEFTANVGTTDKDVLIKKFADGASGVLNQFCHRNGPTWNFNGEEASAWAAEIAKHRWLIADAYVLYDQPDRELIVHLEPLAQELAKLYAAHPDTNAGMDDFPKDLQQHLAKCKQAWGTLCSAAGAVDKMSQYSKNYLKNQGKRK